MYQTTLMIIFLRHIFITQVRQNKYMLNYVTWNGH